ncbi:MAG: protein kinase [Candidatus Aminicenantes bacterium]|nr:protein kinase [Candidatus Aminicenantes bacterium]
MAITCPKCRFKNPDSALHCSQCGESLKPSDRSNITKTLVSSAESLRKGTTLSGRYTILEELGRGGMGVVYKAEDTKLKRTVALKFLPTELTHIPEVKARFMREAQAAAALDHPNICTVHEFDETGETTFISMAYVEGQNLRKKIESGPLEMEEALQIASQVAEGLQEAHKKGIVHRDIKSGNIMVTEKGQAKIMDFGLARKTEGTLLTREGSTMGTIAYMSPEQAQGEKVDHRSDIWSFGVVLYEMLTGQLPFKGDHEQAVVYSIRKDKPEPVTFLRSEIPVSIEQVVSKALEKDPHKRYQKIDDLIEDLKSISAGIVPEEIKARLRKARLRKRKRVISLAGSAALIFIGAIIGFKVFWKPPVPIEKSIAVLPFINDSPDQENTYFINGVMEEILGNLQKIKALRVISRTSVEQYRDRKKSVREIAEELGVNYIVEGSAQKYGNAFRMRTQLIAADRETHLWGQSFQQEITDVENIFNIQSSIAESIAAELKAVIALEERKLIETIPTTDLTAYDAYLKGKFYMYNATSDDMNTAMEVFELAKERDPEFALAYVGMAQVWMFRQQMGYASPDEAGPKIKEAVERALELDSTLAELHYMLANMNYLVIWDWEKGEKAFKKAIEINPNHAEAHALYSHLLIILGRPEEAMGHAELSLKLDPHNPGIIMWYSAALLFERRYDECILFCREFYEKNPTTFWFLTISLSIALHMKEKYDEAFEALKVAMSTQYEDFDHVFDQFEKLGYAGTLNLEADTLLEQSKTKYLSQFDIASIYAFAGNKEQALDCLKQAYEMRDPVVPYIGVYPNLAILHDEPRFQELLRKMNLPVGK